MKPYANLHSSYGKLIDKAAEAGLVELRPARVLPIVGGRPAHGGGFAVAKDDVEDRWISPNEITNDLIDEARLVKVEMPYAQQLRAMVVPKDRKLLVSKRDARHYFHRLRAGAKWRRWLALPPVKK